MRIKGKAANPTSAVELGGVNPEIQLIQLFVWVCQAYDRHPTLKYQRWSRNPTLPAFTDQEVVTIYLFGMLQGHFKQSAIHQYVKGHWAAWFPHLPSYQAFNHRLNLLQEIWPVLLGDVWCELGCPAPLADTGVDQLIDSLPIMMAVRGRSYNAKVATELADQSYCESKKIWYHGVKLHFARHQTVSTAACALGVMFDGGFASRLAGGQRTDFRAVAGHAVW